MGRAGTTTSAALPPGPPLPALVQTLVVGNLRHHVLPLLKRRYGSVVRMRFAPHRDIVMLTDLDDIKTVFTGPVTTFHGGEGNVTLKPLMGDHSVLVTDEDTHLRARKLLMPAFNGAALRGYRAMITGLTRAELDRWPENRAFGAHDRMRALTMEIILRVVFGVAEGPRLEELRRLIGHLVELDLVQVIGWQSPRLQRYRPWRTYAERQARVDELLYAEISERRQVSDLAQRTDVLSRLLTVPADGDELSDAELRDQLVTLLLAGHETTATALAWALHEISRDPEQAAFTTRAADEGDEKALEAVMKESLRLRPVVGEVVRRLTEDVEIGGYRIPAGFDVMPSILVVHGDGDHHPDAKLFRPQRFLDGSPPAGSWLPFGGGARRCLGAGFSLLEGSIVLRELFGRFAVAPEHPRPERIRSRPITLEPARGARIKVTGR
ncbi:cytochrome P450 [Amycolatopsis thailandensis]|uniref:Cytochrome P450 n=2 Tax=Amycolatopsis thailandensis TaxID=589330 RepID=A0A229SC93_9PSEU|nr:cytochrome P450 [Amycolatopsis thailandensis]OXM56547.1 cytochrome P450 [Amycolatopsis thailandensis]